ncbi:MAG: hypothetical protein ABIO76_08810 [Ginsengibacter sp.]
MVPDDKTYTPLKVHYAGGSGKLKPEIKNESEASNSASSIRAPGNSLLDAGIKRSLEQALGIKIPVTNPQTWMINQRNKFLSGWKKEYLKMSPKEPSEIGLSLSLEQDDRVLVMYENEKLITIAHYSFSFTGGAHGNYGTSLTTLQKPNGKQLTIKDVLTPAGMQALPAILDKVARTQFGTKNTKPLDQNYFLVNKTPVTENFYLTASELSLLYAPYKIFC